MFTSPSDIQPFLEPPRIGRTSLFCRELATRYQCWVVGGYPELASGEGEGPEQGKPGFNSAVLVSPTGKVVGNYRKSFLFDTDKTWAREGEDLLRRYDQKLTHHLGDGFKVFDLPPPLGRTVIGICMGMLRLLRGMSGLAEQLHRHEPERLHRPIRRIRTRQLCENKQRRHPNRPVSRILSLYDVGRTPAKPLKSSSMNWLEPPQEPPDDAEAIREAANDSDGPEMSTLNYWAHRLMPLHDPAPGYHSEAESSGKEVVFVACNRVGTESGKLTSCLKMPVWC